MRAFVELVASLGDSVVASTLRQMWVISSKKAWTDNKEKRAEYQSKIDELMVALQPTTLAIAA